MVISRKVPKQFPKSLRVLEWPQFPSQSLPSNFDPKRLAIFRLPASSLMSLELAKLMKKFVNIRELDFSECCCITEIPDVSSVPNLEKISFQQCKNLIKIHPSVGFLDKLRILDAAFCNKLESFPPINLTSLKELELSGCWSLESFPEILGEMENITELYLVGTPIKKLPFSIQNLTRLQKIELSGCGWGQIEHPSNTAMSPELELLNVWGCQTLKSSKQDEGEEKVSSNVELLDIRNCNISDEFLRIGLTWFANVKQLYLSESNFTILPACLKECRFLWQLDLTKCRFLQEIRGIPPNIELFYAEECTSLKELDLTLLPVCTTECRFLRKLYLDGCLNLQEIRGIPPNLEYFSAKDCRSIPFPCRSMLMNEEWHEAGGKMVCLPGTRIPEWFEHQSRGVSISFWFRDKFPAISVCLFSGGCPSFPVQVLDLKLIINQKKVFSAIEEFPSYLLFNHIMIFDLKPIGLDDYVDEALSENEWNHVMFSIDLENKWNQAPGSEIVVRGLGSLHEVIGSNLSTIIVSTEKENEWNPFYIQTGLHVFKQKGSMENIRFNDPYISMLLKEKHRLDTVASKIKFMQHQQNLASLEPHVGQGLPPPALNDNVNWDSNLTVSMRTSRTTSVPGCGIASRKRKIGTSRLDLDNEAGKPFCQATSKQVLDSDSIMSSWATDTASDGELMEHLQSTKRKGDDEYDYGEELELNNDIDNQDMEGEQHSASMNHQFPGSHEMVNNEKETDANSSRKFLGPLRETQQESRVTSIHEDHDKELMLLKKVKLDENGNLSLESSNISLSHLLDTQASEKMQKAWQILVYLVSNKLSLLLHPGCSALMKDTLRYLLSLPPKEGISRVEIQQLSEVFAQLSLEYKNARLKRELTDAVLSKAEKVKNDFEANVTDLDEVETLEKYFNNQLGCLQERNGELEEQIKDIKAEIANLTQETDTIATNGRLPKVEIDDLRNQVTRLKVELDWAKTTQANIEADWFNFGEYFIGMIQRGNIQANTS